MDPLRAFVLRQRLEDEAAIAKDEATRCEEGSPLYYYDHGRASAFAQALEWLDRCMSGPHPDPGTEDFPPGTP